MQYTKSYLFPSVCPQILRTLAKRRMYLSSVSLIRHTGCGHMLELRKEEERKGLVGVIRF